MNLKIIDEYTIKNKNKIRDDSFKKFCDENKNNNNIDHVKIIRSMKTGEIILWEIHNKK